MSTTDELVARLRLRREAEFIDGYERVEWEDDDALYAADTIETLTRERDEARQWVDDESRKLENMEARADAAEARIAKLEADKARLREALEEMHEAALSGYFYEDYDAASERCRRARAALEATP